MDCIIWELTKWAFSSFVPQLFCNKRFEVISWKLSILLNLLPRLYDLNNYKLISYFLFLNEKFLITLIFFLVSFWIKLDKELFSFVSIIITMYIFILFFIYLSTPHDFYFQLDSTAARVIRSLSFVMAFFGLYNLRNYKISY